MVYRRKTTGSGMGYNKNLTVSARPPPAAVEMGLGYPLTVSDGKGSQPLLGTWAAAWDNAGKFFVQLDSAKPGTVAPPPADAVYADVAFFKAG